MLCRGSPVLVYLIMIFAIDCFVIRERFSKVEMYPFQIIMKMKFMI